MTSSSGIPIARHLDMQSSMLFAGPRMLPECRSVLMLSGGNPSSIARFALRNQKLPAPWPRSNQTPRARASRM